MPTPTEYYIVYTSHSGFEGPYESVAEARVNLENLAEISPGTRGRIVDVDLSQREEFLRAMQEPSEYGLGYMQGRGAS